MKVGALPVAWGLLPVLIVPWLMPPQYGPSPSTVPELFSLGCLGLLLACAAWGLQNTAAASVGALLAGAWLLAALASAVIGLLQYFGLADHFGFMSSAAVGEAYGNLRQRNQFATLTNMGLMALLWWHGQPVIRKLQWGSWLLPQGAALLLGVANAASVSRTGLLQLLLIAALMPKWKSQDQGTRWLLMTAVLAYLLASMVLPLLSGLDAANLSIIERFQSADDVCTSRWTLWSNVLQLIAQRPWLGWGWGELDYAHWLTVYQGPRFCELLDNAHNLPLHLAVELGIPLASLVCGASLWLVWRERPWREHDSNRQLAWGVLALILLHSMVEYPLWYGPFQLSLVMCLGLLLWPGAQRALRGNGQSQGRTRVGVVLAGMSLGGFAFYAAWDYHRISQIYMPPEQRAPAYRENTLEKIRSSWLFRDQVRFAEFTITPLTQNNAEQLHAMGLQLLHFSPEARVVEKLIECAVMLGRDEEARFYLGRYKDAYPQEHARWAAAQQPVQHQD